MGLLNLLRGLRKNEKGARLLILGLDNSGKTSYLKKMTELKESDNLETVMPTKGFNVKSLHIDGIKFDIWDIGGQQSIRPYWHNYFDGVDVLIYVVDSGDRSRIEETGLQLAELLNETKLSGIPLLVLANKMDLLNKLKASEIAEHLGLHKITDRRWHIIACSAFTGEGLKESISWLVKQVNSS